MMDSEVFTPLLEDFMLTPLVSWVRDVLTIHGYLAWSPNPSRMLYQCRMCVDMMYLTCVYVFR